MTLPHALEDFRPSTGDVGALFADEIANLGGTLVDVVDQGTRLFGRALLADAADVTPGDTIRGGIAIHARGPHVSVHGYTYRQVCANGAIAAVPGEQFWIERAGPWSPIELVTPILDATRDALRQCAASPVFDRTVAQMRRATQADPSQALRVLPALMYAMSAHAPVGWRDRVMHEVTRRWLADRDRSLFGVLNAVTATARDEPNPALKWELESVGGMLLQGAMLPRRAHADRPTRTIAAAPSEVGELVEVGR